MTDPRPGFDPRRLVRLMAAAVARCDLDLGGAVVLTEAATGPYAVTPVLAAMAGARRVYAVTRMTRYGSVEEVRDQTAALAAAAGVAGAVTVLTEKPAAVVAEADIVTNSGHVRPIDAVMVGAMRPGAAVPLMYEAWEFRAGDVDLEACRRRGVRVAGTNERHPAVDVFSYLGVMAVKLLLDAGVSVYGSDVGVLCDNPFGPFLRRGLEGAGARVEVADGPGGLAGFRDKDAVLVALTPRDGPLLGPREAAVIADRCPGAVLAQYFGDVDRAALAAAGVPCWPAREPPAGHMGVLPSAVGPEPVVRLQAGGLKVGEVIWRTGGASARPDHPFIDRYL